MPLYRKSRLVHIHIPKTAGTAIESFFHSIGDMVWGRDSWFGQEYVQQRWYEYQHLTMREFSILSVDEFRNFHSFAVIRNPYSRLISEFFWRRRVIHQRPGAPMIAFHEFAEFIRAIPPDIDTDWESYPWGASQMKTNFLIHVRPQFHYVYDENGKQIVGEILRFEHLKSDFDQLLSRQGLKTDMIQQPREKNVDAFFDRELLDYVNSIYARDFALGDFQML